MYILIIINVIEHHASSQYYYSSAYQFHSQSLLPFQFWLFKIFIVCFCLLQEIIRERHSFKKPYSFLDFGWSMHCRPFTGLYCVTMEENNFLIIVGMMELLCFCCLIYHGNSVNFVSWV